MLPEIIGKWYTSGIVQEPWTHPEAEEYMIWKIMRSLGAIATNQVMEP